MGVLSGLEPLEVFRFFEEICGIPHGSGNVGQISDYLVRFAGDRGLWCVQDELKNVIIVKEASAGYEKEPTVILQGHMDMVAVKKPELIKDMKKEGLKLAMDGDSIYAEGTSLGGDDGIAVAYALALLNGKDIPHPRLEVVITVDEEVGMDGANGIDLSMLQGRRLLNVDSEEEGIFMTSCAGGARINCYLPVEMKQTNGVLLSLCVEGLKGGHSGVEIDKEGGNSNILLGRILYRLTGRMPVRIAELSGGVADNAIPRRTEARIVIDAGEEASCLELLREIEKEIRSELAVKDPDFRIVLNREGEGGGLCTEKESTAHMASFLAALPNGVCSMSADIPGLVETSLNLGIMELDQEEQELVCGFSVRSSMESAKHALLGKVGAVTELAGGSYSVSGDYPGWAYRADSPLRDSMLRVYERMYGSKPQVQALHAGLECGILAGKIEDLDCISFGPDMKNIHTTEEILSISSTRRVWEYLLEVLKEKEN